jgi:hypothetical protein
MLAYMLTHDNAKGENAIRLSPISSLATGLMGRWDHRRDRVAPREPVTAAFPVSVPGRLPHQVFRGLLKFGRLARRTPTACPWSHANSVTLNCAKMVNGKPFRAHRRRLSAFARRQPRQLVCRPTRVLCVQGKWPGQRLLTYRQLEAARARLSTLAELHLVKVGELVLSN